MWCDECTVTCERLTRSGFCSTSSPHPSPRLHGRIYNPPHTAAHTTRYRLRMRRSRAQPSLPAAVEASWTCLTLLICLCMKAVAIPRQAFVTPSTTPRKLSIPTPYLVYVTPPIPTEAGPREAWFERVSPAKSGLVSLRHTPHSSLPLTFHRSSNAPRPACPWCKFGIRCCLPRYVMKRKRNLKLFYLPVHCIPYPDLSSPQALAPHVTRCRELLDAAALEQQQAQSKTFLLVNGHPDMHADLDGAHFPEALMERIPGVLLGERQREEEQQQQQQQPFVTGVSVHSVVRSARRWRSYF